MDGDHVGSGTAVIALGLLVGCRSVAPSGVLQCDHLHVVCHGRGRHDRARGSFGRHQHRASAQPAARTLPRAAQALSQHGGQARPAHGLMGAHGVAAVPKPGAGQRSACSGRGRRQDPQAGQEDARGQAVASAIGIQHQARVHHGALPASRQFARACGSQRVRCTARRADP